MVGSSACAAIFSLGTVKLPYLGKKAKVKQAETMNWY
jgi:hypothetical protein